MSKVRDAPLFGLAFFREQFRMIRNQSQQHNGVRLGLPVPYYPFQFGHNIEFYVCHDSFGPSLALLDSVLRHHA